MIGIIQEQHPDRCRLFMQWKEMGWPILVDSLNLLDVAVVPITLLIDERGIIRETAPPRADPLEVVRRFLERPADPSAVDDPAPVRADLKQLGTAAESGGASEWRTYGEALALWGGSEEIDRSIAAFRRAIELDPDDGRAEFRLGVAYRMRYDRPGGEAADFRRAVSHWARAKEIDPNQYIWMRRLQQYGPRLWKPYPFYDWVDQARSEIEGRGETPVALPVEPHGAELAGPAQAFDSDDSAEEPDNAGRIHRDPGKFVRIHSTQVPTRVEPGKTTRIHLELRPNEATDSHWNNEVGGLIIWVDPPEGWQVDRRKLSLPTPPHPVSDEPRLAELEIRAPKDGGDAELTGYALYYVCEGLKGQCLYRRQDLRLALRIDR
jgi:hypothetical protein